MTTSQFARQLQSLTSSFPAAARRAADAVAVVAAGAVKKGLTDGTSPDGKPFLPLGWSRPQGGSKPLLNTGVLRASVTAEADGTGLTIRAHAPGARLHQEGGVIVPKRAKALTIPLTKEAVRAGGARHFPRPLFVLSGKDGSGALAERPDKGKARGKLVVHYLLRKSVTVPARPYLGVSAETAQRIGAVLAQQLARSMAEGT
jgi:phage gpG-like protein